MLKDPTQVSYSSLELGEEELTVLEDSPPKSRGPLVRVAFWSVLFLSAMGAGLLLRPLIHTDEALTPPTTENTGDIRASADFSAPDWDEIPEGITIEFDGENELPARPDAGEIVERIENDVEEDVDGADVNSPSEGEIVEHIEEVLEERKEAVDHVGDSLKEQKEEVVERIEEVLEDENRAGEGQPDLLQCWDELDEWICSDELWEARGDEDVLRELEEMDLREFKGMDLEEAVATVPAGVIMEENIVNMVDAIVMIPTLAQQAEIEEILYNWFYGASGPTGDEWIEKVTHMERFAFHDCITNSAEDGTGGCHACVAVPGSIQNMCKDNDGLELELASLLALYKANTLETVCTAADFMHMAAAIGVKISSMRAQAMGTGEVIDMVHDFQWGRTDCTDQGYDVDAKCGYASRLPSPELNWDGMLARYSFAGLPHMDVVKLMASHALGGMGNHGKAKPGGFTFQDMSFDNSYFQTLISQNWKALKVKGFKKGTQWDGSYGLTDTAQCTMPLDSTGMPMMKLGKPFGNCWVAHDWIGCTEGPDCVIAPDQMYCCGKLSVFKTGLELGYNTEHKVSVWEVNKVGELVQRSKDCSMNAFDQKALELCPGDRPGMAEVQAMGSDTHYFATAYKEAHKRLNALGYSHMTLYPAGLEPHSWTVQQRAATAGWVSARIRPAPAPEADLEVVPATGA